MITACCKFIKTNANHHHHIYAVHPTYKNHNQGLKRVFKQQTTSLSKKIMINNLRASGRIHTNECTVYFPK